MNIRSVDENTKVIVPNKIKKIFLTGEKDVYEVATKSGRKLKATLDHRFFTPNGYMELKDLSVGDKVYANGKELLENEDWLREMYLEKNLTRKQLAETVGCCESYVHRAFKKFNIVKEYSNYPNRQAGHGVKGMHSEEEKKRISDRMRGSNNHQWSDNKTEQEARQLARRRHKKTVCEICGSTHGRLEQHHWDKNPLNYDESNLITLCVHCHKAVHGISKKAVFCDEVVSITYVGKEEVYDIEMQGIHNFVANGLVVHNCQESQRYCNYGKDKFGSQITFIKPSWWNTKSADKEIFKKALLEAEETYLKAIKAWDERKEDKRFRTKHKGNPLSPQMARMILPNATKTELVMTGFASDWEHFFKLRCSQAAHPDARYLANKLKSLMTKNNEN
jgi:thymidylate synthase (FAD)